MPSHRIGRPGGESLVHADVLESRLAVLQLLVVLLDQLEGRICHRLVVVAPLTHRAHRIVVDLCRVRDVVALPGVGLVLLDLLFDESQVALADIEHAVSEHPGGAGGTSWELSGISALPFDQLQRLVGGHRSSHGRDRAECPGPVRDGARGRIRDGIQDRLGPRNALTSLADDEEAEAGEELGLLRALDISKRSQPIAQLLCLPRVFGRGAGTGRALHE